MEYVSVLILNKSLSEVGLLTNATFVLGLTAGRLMPEKTFGSKIVDGDGREHEALTNVGHYVRKASATKLRELRNTFADMTDVQLVDYPEDAAPADYQSFAKELASHHDDEISYRAVHVYGPAEQIVPLTKNLSRA